MKVLELCPMTLKEANAYVEQHHRHHGPVVGHKFSIGCSDGEKIKADTWYTVKNGEFVEVDDNDD